MAILDACAHQGGAGEVGQILARIFGTENEKDVIVGTATVNLFSKFGCLEDAWRMFCRMPERNLYSWNGILAASSHLHQIKDAFELYSQMLCEGVLPNAVTFIHVFSLCTSSKAQILGECLHHEQCIPIRDCYW